MLRNLRVIARRRGWTAFRLGWMTALAGGYGFILGHIATKYGWPFGYLPTIGICLAMSYTILIFQTLTEVYIYPRLGGLPRRKRFILRQISSSVAHVLGWLLVTGIAGLAMGFSLFQWQAFVSLLVMFMLAVLIIHSFHQLATFYRELREMDLLEEKLKALATEAELRALKAQVNPHFLFNALNTIANLIATDTEKAEESVERLANILRHSLSISSQEFTTVGKELEFIDSYLAIERARFGDKLKFTKDISPDVLGTPIPCFSLQPLVENSIKHGLSANGEVRLAICGHADGGSVNIEIKDEGRGMPEQVIGDIHTNGTGLRNVNERLQKTYGAEYGLRIRKNEPVGTIVMVTIPRKRE